MNTSRNIAFFYYTGTIHTCLHWFDKIIITVITVLYINNLRLELRIIKV